VTPLWIRFTNQSAVDATLCRRAPNLKDEPRLQLKHPRRVDVRKRRDRVSVRAYRVSGREQTESGERCRQITVGRNTATEEVSMVENVESLQAEQKPHALCQLNAILYEDRHVGSWGAAER